MGGQRPKLEQLSWGGYPQKVPTMVPVPERVVVVHRHRGTVGELVAHVKLGSGGDPAGLRRHVHGLSDLRSAGALVDPAPTVERPARSEAHQVFPGM